MLTDRQKSLWDAYLVEEGRAPREAKLRALGVFLDALEESPHDDWFPWARSIAEGVVDRGDDLVIRQPLFHRAVFPALLAGLREGRPGCARWLAGLAQNLYQCKDCRAQLPEDEQTEVALLRAALRHDPGDRASRRRLIAALADGFAYSLHEVPSGVLYSIGNGATIEECGWLLDELEEFRGLVQEEGLAGKYRDLIRDGSFHFHSYRRYLADREGTSSYPEYLSRHPMPADLP
jgi:hypothetical protein